MIAHHHTLRDSEERIIIHETVLVVRFLISWMTARKISIRIMDLNLMFMCYGQHSRVS